MKTRPSKFGPSHQVVALRRNFLPCQAFVADFPCSCRLTPSWSKVNQSPASMEEAPLSGYVGGDAGSLKLWHVMMPT